MRVQPARSESKRQSASAGLGLHRDLVLGGNVWTHLEQVGAAEEHEVDPGHRGELRFCQGEGRQQRGWQGDLGQRVHLVRLKMDLQGREEGFRWTQTQLKFSAQRGNLLVPEAQRCWAPKRH